MRSHKPRVWPPAVKPESMGGFVDAVDDPKHRSNQMGPYQVHSGMQWASYSA